MVYLATYDPPKGPLILLFGIEQFRDQIQVLRPSQNLNMFMVSNRSKGNFMMFDVVKAQQAARYQTEKVAREMQDATLVSMSIGDIEFWGGT